MTQKRMLALLSALVLGLGVNAAPAQGPKDGCGKTSVSPNQTGSLIFGIGYSGDAGLTGSIILNEQNFNCTKCPTAASSLGVCEQCPDCDSCPGCYQKCPDCEGCCTKAQACPGCSAGKCTATKGTFTVGVGFTLLPGPLPLPVPVLNANVTGAAAASCCPPSKACPAAVGVYEPEEKEFAVETRLVERRSGRQEQLLCAPRVTVLEGQPASVILNGGVAQAGDPLLAGIDGLVQVQVEELDSGDLLLDLTVQKNTVEKSNKSGTVVVCRRLAAVQEVKPGKPTKLVLEKDDQGGARTWVEVIVKDASAKDAVDPTKRSVTTPAPAYEYTAEPLPPPRAIAPPMAAPPVPVTVFVPQLMPPQPAPMMIPAAAAVPCPRPVSELIPCNVPTVVSMPAANLASVFRAIKEDGHARLEVLHGPFSRMTCPSMTWGAPGCKALKFTVAGERVHVSGDQLKAYANRVIADAEDRLVMEGQVRLTYTPVSESGAQGAPRHIKADKVVFHLDDGHLDIEMKPMSKD